MVEQTDCNRSNFYAYMLTTDKHEMFVCSGFNVQPVNIHSYGDITITGEGIQVLT